MARRSRRSPTATTRRSSCSGYTTSSPRCAMRAAARTRKCGWSVSGRWLALGRRWRAQWRHRWSIGRRSTRQGSGSPPSPRLTMLRSCQAVRSTTIYRARSQSLRPRLSGWRGKDAASRQSSMPPIGPPARRRAVTLGRTKGARLEREAVKWLVSGRTTSS